MSIVDGHDAIIRRIVAMDGAPNISLPNDIGVDVPRYVIQEAGGSVSTVTIGGITMSEPEVAVRVETENGDSTGQSGAMIRALLDLFPVNLRFDGMKVIRSPDVRPALPGTPYSVPVIIRVRNYN